jgi:hypothetical protein
LKTRGSIWVDGGVQATEVTLEIEVGEDYLGLRVKDENLKRDKVRCKIEQERKLVNHEDLGS